jgi:hypothetical protein
VHGFQYYNAWVSCMGSIHGFQLAELLERLLAVVVNPTKNEFKD